MSGYTSKIDVLFKINELTEAGDYSGALRLQKLFLSSLKEDQNAGAFSPSIQLDRKSKKVISNAGLELFQTQAELA